MPIHLHTTRGCLHATMAELSSWDKDNMAYKDANIYYLTLDKHSLLTPGTVEKTDTMLKT